MLVTAWKIDLKNHWIELEAAESLTLMASLELITSYLNMHVFGPWEEATLWSAHIVN